MKPENLVCKPVDATTWSDLEKLFKSKGSPHHCWCMVWRNMGSGLNRNLKSDKKKSLKEFVENKIPVGIVCYSGNEPVAWCSVAPRESYRELSGDKSLDDVWSLVCFFIKRPFREQGISELLIRESIKYARSEGAQFLEAYPVEKDSPSYRFMGIKPLFEKLGFEFVKKAGTRRNVMVKNLNVS